MYVRNEHSCVGLKNSLVMDSSSLRLGDVESGPYNEECLALKSPVITRLCFAAAQRKSSNTFKNFGPLHLIVVDNNRQSEKNVMLRRVKEKL